MSKKDLQRKTYPLLFEFVHVILPHLHTNVRELKSELHIGSSSLHWVCHGTDTSISHYIDFFRLSFQWLDYRLEFFFLLQTFTKMLESKDNLVVGVQHRRTGEIKEWHTVLIKNKL